MLTKSVFPQLSITDQGLIYTRKSLYFLQLCFWFLQKKKKPRQHLKLRIGKSNTHLSSTYSQVLQMMPVFIKPEICSLLCRGENQTVSYFHWRNNCREAAETRKMWRDTHMQKLQHAMTPQWGYKHSCRALYDETETAVKSLWNYRRKATSNKGDRTVWEVQMQEGFWMLRSDCVTTMFQADTPSPITFSYQFLCKSRARWLLACPKPLTSFHHQWQRQVVQRFLSTSFPPL